MFLTNFFFNTDIEINIRDQQVPYLMVYYGFVACALYFVLFLLYRRALGVKDRLELNDFEVFYTRSQKKGSALCSRCP